MNRETQREIIFQALLDVGRDEYGARKDSFIVLEARDNIARFVSLQLAMTTNKGGKPQPESVSAILQRAGFTAKVVS